MMRVVLDTNIVISALLFNSARFSRIRHAWMHGTMTPLVCRETVTELVRVLAYPKFRLSTEQQQIVLASLLPFSVNVQLPDAWPDLPQCRDPKDQVFLVLAHTGQAQALITGDADLLCMRDAFPGLIMSLEEWERSLPSSDQFM